MTLLLGRNLLPFELSPGFLWDLDPPPRPNTFATELDAIQTAVTAYMATYSVWSPNLMIHNKNVMENIEKLMKK